MYEFFTEFSTYFFVRVLRFVGLYFVCWMVMEMSLREGVGTPYFRHRLGNSLEKLQAQGPRSITLPAADRFTTPGHIMPPAMCTPVRPYKRPTPCALLPTPQYPHVQVHNVFFVSKDIPKNYNSSPIITNYVLVVPSNPDVFVINCA